VDVPARRRDDARFTKVETTGPRSHVHHFRLRGPGEVDAEVAGAYQVGLQRHLARRG
jgi:hypothetical protein